MEGETSGGLNKELQATKESRRYGLPREEHINWLCNTKWSGLKTYNYMIQMDQVVPMYLRVCVHACVCMYVCMYVCVLQQFGAGELSVFCQACF